MSIEEKLHLRSPRRSIRWEWIASGMCVLILGMMLMVRMYFVYHAPPAKNIPELPQVEAPYDKSEPDKLAYYQELQEKTSQAERAEAHRRQQAQNYFDALQEKTQPSAEPIDSVSTRVHPEPEARIQRLTSPPVTSTSKPIRKTQEEIPATNAASSSVQFHTTVIPTQADEQEPTRTEGSSPVNQPYLAKAMILGTQNVVVGEMVQLQLLESLELPEAHLPAQTLFYATLSQYGDRVLLQVNQIKYQDRFVQVDLEAVDAQGNRGLMYEAQRINEVLRQEGEALITDVLDQVVPHSGGITRTARRLLTKNSHDSTIEFPDGMELTFNRLTP